MNAIDPNVAADASAFTDYLGRHERKSLLRFLTCGSVDDGKSTLIGRLLYDSKLLFVSCAMLRRLMKKLALVLATVQCLVC